MSMADEEGLRRKRLLFDGLYALDDASEDLPDDGLLASIAALESTSNSSKSFAPAKQTQAAAIPSNTHSALARTVNAPASSDQAQNASSSHVNHGILNSTTVTAASPAVVQHRHTTTGAAILGNMPTSSANPRASGKRKRDSTITLVPLDQQLFGGLNFYFFPNNDIHPGRRMRITKALQYGATWQKDWSSTVTHVIVDQSMNYAQVLAFLKVQALPTGVALVDEKYPADCISYKVLLDPKQSSYAIKGHVQPAEDVSLLPGGPVRSQTSDTSLQLKPAGRAVMTREPQTPSTREPTPAMASVPDASRVSGVAKVPSEALVARPEQDEDELDRVIRDTKMLQHVPLDLEEDDDHRPSSSSNYDTDDEEPAQAVPKPKPDKSAWQDKFQCMQAHDGDNTSNPNAATISILQQMADYYAQIHDEWRPIAYRKAIATLRNHPHRITSRSAALALPHIGERLALKIEEIAYTSRLRRLDSARAEPTDATLQTFLRIYGVGYAQASKWVAAGHRSLEHLLQRAALTPNQKLGIAHYDDFNARIPRTEVEAHAAVVSTALRAIDPEFECLTMGSYRRGARDSGDIDVVITHPSAALARIRQVVVETLIPGLYAQGFLRATVADISASSSSAGSSDNGGTSWHGASCLPQRSVWRRLDLLLVPVEELGAALIYFTGNDVFNRSLRLLASRKGMRLNQRGLYRNVLRGKGREKLSEGELVEGRDERRIFEALGVPYRPPEHRIC